MADHGWMVMTELAGTQYREDGSPVSKLWGDGVMDLASVLNGVPVVPVLSGKM